MNEKYTIKGFKNGRFSIRIGSKEEHREIEQFLEDNDILIKDCTEHHDHGMLVSISIKDRDLNRSISSINLNQIEEYKNKDEIPEWVKDDKYKTNKEREAEKRLKEINEEICKAKKREKELNEELKELRKSK